MAITATTLSAAVLVADTTIGVASAAGITAGNMTTGVGIIYLFVESEVMAVTGVTGTLITVQRGQAGTRASAHGNTCSVLIGSPTDFGPFVPAVSAQQDASPAGSQFGFSAPVASAATIVASGPLFHVTGGVAINIITPPTGMFDGQVTIVFDSACTWTVSAVTNGIAVTGTNTTAASAVTFYLDAATNRWYPSRLA